MPSVSRRLLQLAVGCAVIVILLVMVPRSSSAQTAPSLSVGAITHSADGTTVATLSASSEELATLAVFVDGEPVPFEVGDSAGESAAHVVFAIENSVSMTAAQLAELQSSLAAFVAELNISDEVGLVTFGGGASVALPLTTDRVAFEAAAGAITSGGGSALYSGVGSAAEVLAQASGPSLLVLVTYGWDWGGLSTHTRDASLTAVSDAGAAVYVQSMVFDGSVDAAYLAPLASDGLIHNATEVAALPSAMSLLGSVAPTRTLTFSAPPLLQGTHELRVTSETGAERVSTFEVTNDGLLTVAIETAADATSPIAVEVTTATAPGLFEVTATLAGTTLELAADGRATIDPWAFSAGSAGLEVTATLKGVVAATTSRSITVPELAPLLTVDQSETQTLTAVLQSQPGAANSLVAVVDGSVIAESTSSSLQVDRPRDGTLTFEVRANNGTVVGSESVSATVVVDAPADGGQSAGVGAESNDPPIWTSPTMLAIPLAMIVLAVLIRRRQTPSRPSVVDRVAELSEPIEEEPGVEAPVTADLATPVERPIEIPVAPEPLEPPEADEPEVSVVFDEAEVADVADEPDVADEHPEAEPIPLQRREDDRRSKPRFGRFDRRKTEPPTPIRLPEWTVVVRAPDGENQRVDVAYEPVSIGASKLCTITLDGDAVRFVHLVIAREGHELKAHQFGPVTINGKARDVEDEAVLTEAVMEIGDVSVWLERAVADQTVVGTA